MDQNSLGGTAVAERPRPALTTLTASRPSSAPATPLPAEPRGSWAAVAIAGLSVFMATTDSSIVNVALPTLSQVFATPPSTLQWVVLAYNLPLVAFVLAAGRWADTVDTRRAFVIGVWGFAVASGLVGLAPAFGGLVGARVVQGVFAAIISALVPAVAVGAVPAEQRGRALGLVTTIGPLGAVAGPPLGSLLLPAFGWSSIFLVNVPVGLAAGIIASRVVPSRGRLSLPARAMLVDGLLLGVASLALFLVLGRVAEARLEPDVELVGLLAIALAAAGAWWRIPHGASVRQMLVQPAMGQSLAALVLLVSAAAGITYLLPFFLQGVLARPLAEVGLTVLAFPLVMALTGPLGGYATDRWGGRVSVRFGGIVMALGCATLLPLDHAWTALDVGWRLGVLGLGTGLFAGPNMSVLMSVAGPAQRSTAAGLAGLSRTLGFALGPAMATAAWCASGELQTAVAAALISAAIGAVVLAWRT